MKCTNCNNDLTGTENFCRKCGFPVKKEENQVEKKEDSSSDTQDKLGNTSIDLKEVISSDSLKKDEKYKIENTQELLINSSDSSKKIKKILDELKLIKSDENSNNNSVEEEKNEIKKDFEESKKKIEKLQSEKENINSIVSESTVIVDSSKINKIVEEKKEKDNENIINNTIDKISDEKNLKESSDNTKFDENTNTIVEKNENFNEDKNDDEEVYVEEASSNNGTGRFVFVLLLFILTLCLSIYLLICNFSLSDKLSKSEEKSNNQVDINSNINSNSLSNSNSNSQTISSYGCYNLAGLSKLKVLNSSIVFDYNNLNLELSINSDILLENIKVTKDDYKKLLEAKGYTISSYGTKVIEEREYVFFETVGIDKTSKYLILYTAGLNKDSFMFKINYLSNPINFDDIKIINKFISTLKCNGNDKLSINDYFIKK